MSQDPIAVLAERPPLSVRDQLTLSVLWFSLNFQSAALLPVVVPTQVLLFVAPGAVGTADQAIFLAWLGALGSVMALIAQPIVGAVSDQTRAGLGRRRPYIAAGCLFMLVGMAAMGLASAATIFIAGFLVLQLSSNTVTAAYQGLLPDRVPAAQRGTASGFLGVMTILGNVGSLGLAALLLGQSSAGAALTRTVRQGAILYYGLTGLVLVAGALITIAGVPERAVSRVRSTTSLDWRQRMLRLWLEPLKHGNFRWVFLTRASVMLGLTLFLTFIEYYFAGVAHASNFVTSTVSLALLALLAATAGALTLGMLSDRTGRVRLVSVATALMAAAAVVFVVTPGGIPLWPLGLLFGVGFGAYTSVDWALAVDSLPSLDAAGKDMGIWSIASTLPAVLAPLLGGLVIGVAAGQGRTAVGYRAVFGLAAFFFVLGAIFILKVREQRPASTMAPVALE